MTCSPEILRRAAEILRAGGLVAFPTETVYGLGANALDAGAVRRIFTAKGRPATSPLIVHVASVEMAREMVAAEWPERAETLAREFWPGPLSLVLPKRAEVPGEVTAGLPTVGVRMPDHPVALELIRLAGVPVAAPSANRFTELSPTLAEHVRAALGDRVDLIVDGGETAVGIESTVLSLAGGGSAVLLRPGMVQREDIEAWIGPVGLAGEAAEGESHPAPGMHHKHYSPARTPLFLLPADSPLPEGRGAFLWHSADRPAGAAGRSVRMPREARDYARCIYRTLHDLDREGWDWIAVEPVPDRAEWAAVRDRLSRAATIFSPGTDTRE